MANAYIGSLIDFDRSILRNYSRWSVIQAQLQVILPSLIIYLHVKVFLGW